jgi:NAD(P)-dependent dehydrogenase (short-subunit alcohol dehydrogenase family)
MLITGASTGFGRLTAELFAQSGWRTFAAMRNVATANASIARDFAAAGIEVVELDVTSDASVEAAGVSVLARAGSLDVVVNNAGIAHFGIQEAFTSPQVERTFQTNVLGPLRVNRAFLPPMREHGAGLIVYVSSVVGRLVTPFGGIYASSKWALEALAEASSYELAPFGIDVAIVEPSAYTTEIFAKTEAGADTERAAAYGAVTAHADQASRKIQQRASGTDPSDVARLIYALAEMPPGTRPLRSVTPPNPAVAAINETHEAVQRSMIAAYGVDELIPANLKTAR